MNLAQLFLVFATTAGLSFSPVNDLLPVGTEFEVAINLSSGGTQTLGTDAVILFDPKVLSATKVTPGKLYPNYPETGREIDNVHGKVFLSGTANMDAPLTAQGVFGKVAFRAKKEGKTTLSFDWKEGGTADSNIVPYEGELDLLVSRPTDLNLSFREASFWEKILAFIKRVLSLNYLRL